MMTRALLLSAALVLSTSRVMAQAPPPPVAPPPPRQQPAALPALRPPSAPPPPAASPATAPATTSRAATFATLRPPPAHVGVPPESLRAAVSTPITAPPANAVAQCADGTFLVPPSTPAACRVHGGLRVVIPYRGDPRQLAAQARPAPAPALTAARAPALSNAAAPADATMRCKDGTYLTGPPAEGRCDANGGLAVILVPRPTPPPPPQPRRP